MLKKIPNYECGFATQSLCLLGKCVQTGWLILSGAHDSPHSLSTLLEKKTIFVTNLSLQSRVWNQMGIFRQWPFSISLNPRKQLRSTTMTFTLPSTIFILQVQSNLSSLVVLMNRMSREDISSQSFVCSCESCYVSRFNPPLQTPCKAGPNPTWKRLES